MLAMVAVVGGDGGAVVMMVLLLPLLAQSLVLPLLGHDHVFRV